MPFAYITAASGAHTTLVTCTQKHVLEAFFPNRLTPVCHAKKKKIDYYNVDAQPIITIFMHSRDQFLGL